MAGRFILKPLFRTVLQPYWRLTRGQTLGVRGVVIDDRDRVLLVRHSYAPGWTFPGGGVERDETLVQALRRELAEETGVEIAAPPRLIGVFANFKHFRSDHVALFDVRGFTTRPARSLEIAEQVFFDLARLPDDTTGGTRRRLDELSGNLPPAESW
jgi:ADP-ribose pyrophosphatase YjhB (NUDIX family)